MSARKPVSTPINDAAGKTPVASRASGPVCWTFSFRFWKQIDFFGLDKADPGWFASLLSKFVELGKEPVDAFLADGTKREAYRYHAIKWTQKNIPVQRADLDWIPPIYLENPEEYPIMQFQISLGLGRVVGFWDERDVFNIVLLDPLHNIQPHKDFNYRVDPCSPLPCKYSSLLHDLESAKRSACLFPGECERDAAYAAIPNNKHCHEVVILRLDDQQHAYARSLIDSGRAESMEYLLGLGVDACEYRAQYSTDETGKGTGSIETQIDVLPPSRSDASLDGD